MHTKPPTSDDENTEYCLNFEQALLMCVLSETPEAQEVRVAMIKLLSHVVRLGLMNASPLELKQLETDAEKAVEFLGRPGL
jgi:hypothetical protein